MEGEGRINKPEEITPGNPIYYASSYFSENVFASLLVKNREGRPILLSSNNNPHYGGGINARCQASVLSLYNSNRIKNPYLNGKESNWKDVDVDILNKLNTCSKQIVLLTTTIISPSTNSILQEFKKRFKNFKVVTYDAISQNGILSANQKCFGKRFIPTYNFENADVVVSFDADFLSDWIDPAHARQYAANRKPENGKMSRHYHFESLLSVTGVNADKRVPIMPGDQTQYVLRLYDKHLGYANKKSVNSQETKHDALLNQIAKELWSNKRKSLVVSGSDNTDLQVVINEINKLLNNYESTLSTKVISNVFSSQPQDVSDLILDMNNNKVGLIMFLNT